MIQAHYIYILTPIIFDLLFFQSMSDDDIYKHYIQGFNSLCSLFLFKILLTHLFNWLDLDTKKIKTLKYQEVKLMKTLNRVFSNLKSFNKTDRYGQSMHSVLSTINRSYFGNRQISSQFLSEG